MEFKDMLEQRWSCRAYLPDEVPGSVISEMFDTAQRTASWCNTQPWHAHVISAPAIKRFSDMLLEHARGGEQSSDFEMPREYRGVYQQRRRETGYALYNSLGIQREDRAARLEQSLKNFEFFGAPHVAVITTDREQGVYGAVDCGGYVANLLLAAQSLGVATVPQAAIAMYSNQVREFLKLPEDRLVVCAVSFGYADNDHPANQFRTRRAAVSDAVTMVTAG
ncbi:nitroreductase [Skermania sp. ID1734]|uniref:nitroreductase n=1 Tax=Skermania sp. ID1734 TaxID=2597516 RepID=UPI00117CCC4F|nr:nitroreductase [Skermania sp. ID1734]TSD94084.1 nitroreductase [Skermania sp. ID1734]